MHPGSVNLSAVLGERNILASLPPDFEYGTTGLTVGDRIAQLEKMVSVDNQIIDRGEEISRAVENMTDEETVEFLDRLDTVSQKDALSWLLHRDDMKNN